MKTTTIIRDIVAILVGAFGLIHSQISGQVNIELIAVYAALLGAPGILSLWELRKSKNGSSLPRE